jgi:hypothetical protein
MSAASSRLARPPRRIAIPGGRGAVSGASAILPRRGVTNQPRATPWVPVVDPFFPTALKGRNRGVGRQRGVEAGRRVAPFQGLNNREVSCAPRPFPGRCPGLICLAPLGPGPCGTTSKTRQQGYVRCSRCSRVDLGAGGRCEFDIGPSLARRVSLGAGPADAVLPGLTARL